MRAFVLLVTCCHILVAQVDTGTVSGLITDKSGSVIPGAVMAIKQEATNLTTTLTSNESGFYSAPSLRPGKYVVSATRDGFRPQKSAPFDLRVQDRVEVNFQLEVGAVTSEITISAAAPLLESETSSLGHVVDGQLATELPLNVSFRQACVTTVPNS